jgi:hypothetical protein
MGAFEVRPATCQNKGVTTGAGQAVAIALVCSGDPFVYQIVSNPANGFLSGFNATTGSVTYTPNPIFAGTDPFTYRAVNGTTVSNTATVNVTTTTAPIPPQTQPQTQTKKKKKCKKKKGKKGAAAAKKKCKKKK